MSHLEFERALVNDDIIVRKTKRQFNSESVHIFTISNGKVTHFREFPDTTSAVETWRGVSCPPRVVPDALREVTHMRRHDAPALGHAHP